MSRKKNILFILCDQLRRDCLGCYGSREVHTPAIDSLAEEGTVYNRCYTANPLCTPSRHSIFTGMYPRSHGVYSNGVLARDEGKNLMHLLTGEGYQTANIGKMHFQPTGDPEGRQSEEAKVHWHKDPGHRIPAGFWGYEWIEATVGHSVVTGNYRAWFLENGGHDGMFSVNYTGEHTGGMRMPERLHCSTYVGEKAVAYLCEKRDRDRPFFLTVSFPDPHFPFTPPEELAGGREVSLPVGGPEDLEDRNWRYKAHYTGSWDRDGVKEAATPEGVSRVQTRQRRERTCEMIELVDKNIARIIDALRREGLYEDTLVFFFSDHGELLGDHGLWYKGPFLYESVINVPLLIVDHKNRGLRSGRLVSLVDILPAACHLAGVPIPFWTDGRNPYGEEERDCCLTEYRNGYADQDFSVYALTTERYKLIRFDDGFYELTDLQEDSGECRNVAGDPAYARVMDGLRERLLTELMRTSTNRWPQICAN